jgi:hypothetical protein
VPDTTIGKLYRAGLRVYRQLAKLESQVASYRAKLAAIEAKIQAMDGQLWLPPRTRRVNPYFKPGELPRMAMQLLKDAGGPVSVSYLAVQALAMKGCIYPGPRHPQADPHPLVTHRHGVEQARAGGQAGTMEGNPARLGREGDSKLSLISCGDSIVALVTARCLRLPWADPIRDGSALVWRAWFNGRTTGSYPADESSILSARPPPYPARHESSIPLSWLPANFFVPP